MFRKYVIITLAAVFFLGSTGCTSKKASDDSADVEASDDESLEAAEATENNEDLDSGSNELVAGNSDESLAPDEQLPDDHAAGTGDVAVAGNSDELAPGDLSETPPAEQPPADTMAAAEAPAADMGDEAAKPAPMETAEHESAPAPDIAPTPEPAMESEAPKPSMSLKKIASQPYRQGKILVNAVYIVRDGDTAETISQKVFASKDHVKDLCRVNKYNCDRGLKVGDKMYYNSPQRPNDDTVLKVFYEDAGVQPQMYTAKQGDNIRKVSKTLLGHDRSWMEVWATNDVDSKGDLEEGVQLRYWPSSEAPAPTQTLAQSEPPPAAGDMANEPPPAADGGQPMEAPPAEDLAMNNPPPAEAEHEQLPPAPDASGHGAAAGTIEPPPPPPPPPPPAAETNAQHAGEDMTADPNSQNFMLGVGAVLLLAAAALFISIRKKRARRQIDFNTTTQTQID